MSKSQPPFLRPYRAPAWLPGGHLQTLYPALALRRGGPAFRRETWQTPDADQIVVDWMDAADAQAPVLVLFHGLEGSSASHYSQSLFAAARALGWHGVVPHFRSCGEVENLKLRAYHAGDTDEIDWILARIQAAHPGVPIFAAGVSLGGNALLKWLGEQGAAAHQRIQAGAAVCAPLDLAACGAVLDTGLNRHIYTREFLRTLKAKMLHKLTLHGDTQIDQAEVRRATTLRAFDNLVTAPIHGFRDVDHYWQSSSSKPHLINICVPTLVINARNDPFVPAASLPTQAEVSAAVTLLQPEHGGHVGFASGGFTANNVPGRLDWLPGTLLDFFKSNLPTQEYA